MSGKGAHVQDSSVLERRLRPIYDLLDSGNYKKAIQECDKVLKKSPTLDRARALKALSLLRLGKDRDCVAILDALTNQTPSDDAVLQAMTMCYRELQQLDRISKLYENAVKVEPSNEELHTHLFMSYVRSSDFKQQQQSAMVLYKLAPKNPYYCWAVMSVILQATRGDGSNDAKKRNLLLSLAERMFDKLIQDNKVEAEQEVQLYLMILAEQEKYDKLLQVLDGNMGSMLSGENIQNKLPYLIKLSRWSDVNMLCKESLSENMDRWDLWKHYLKSVFELNSAPNGTNCTNNRDEHFEEPEMEQPDDTPEKVHEFISRLVENGGESCYQLRGPYLARFELCKLLRSKGENAVDLLGDPVELFMEYFRKFGHKPCCVSDLRGYLDLLDPDKRLDLGGKLIRDVGITSTSVPQSEQQMQRHICSLQLSRLCGSHANLTVEHIRAMVTAFSFHYLHGHQTYGQNMLSTDQAPADAYTLLAAHLLYDLHRSTASSRPLLFALVLLNHTLKNSPCNFHVKLLALRIYHVLGCCLGAQSLYDSLDIKHLQLDSMGYLHSVRLATTGHYTAAGNLFDATLKFFSSNYKDSSDHLTFSYKFGSFLKLTEFMDFRERMNNSFHYTYTAVDRLFLSLVQCSSIEQVYALETSPRDDPVAWDLIRNNSDLGVHVTWDPDRIAGPIEEWATSKSTYVQEKAFLKLRVALLDCVQAASQILKVPAELKKTSERLEQELAKWEQLHKQIELENHQPIEQKLLCMPLPSRLLVFLNSPYILVLPDLFRAVTAVATESSDNVENRLTSVKREFKLMVDRICTTFANEKNAEDVHQYMRHNLECLTNVIEILAISMVLCVLCTELIKNASGGGKKAKKKSPFDTKIRESVANLVSTAKAETQRLDDALRKSLADSESHASKPIVFDELSEKLSTLSLCGDEEDGVLRTLAKSHETAIKECRAVLKAKIKLLAMAGGS